MQMAGWLSNYSRWYRDPTSDKARELDLQAITGSVDLGRASVFFSLCLECKTDKKKPWVGLSSGTTLGDAGLLAFAIGHLTRMTVIGAKAENHVIPEVVPGDTPRVGGLVQAFRDSDQAGPSPPYGALLQARSAALALDREYRATAVDVASELATAAIFVPVVVLDGTLHEYSIDAELNEHVRTVEALVASVPGDAEYEAALIPVVTERFAEQQFGSLQDRARRFTSSMLKHVHTIAGALRIEAIDAGTKSDAASGAG